MGGLGGRCRSSPTRLGKSYRSLSALVLRPLGECARNASMEPSSGTRQLTLVSKRDAVEDPQVDCRILAATILPFRETRERSLVRKADKGNTYLAVTAVDPNLPLPHGSDRTVLWWALTRALESGGTVGFDSLPEYFETHGLESNCSEHRRLRDSLDRINALWFQFRIAKYFGGTVEWTTPTFQESYFPLRAEASDPTPEIPFSKDYWFRVAPDLRDLFRTKCVTLPPLLLQQINNHPTQWVLVLFLTLQSSSAISPLTLPIRELRRMLGLNELSIREIRDALTIAIATVKSYFPDFESHLDARGDPRIVTWHGTRS